MLIKYLWHCTTNKLFTGILNCLNQCKVLDQRTLYTNINSKKIIFTLLYLGTHFHSCYQLFLSLLNCITIDHCPTDLDWEFPSAGSRLERRLIVDLLLVSSVALLSLGSGGDAFQRSGIGRGLCLCWSLRFFDSRGTCSHVWVRVF